MNRLIRDGVGVLIVAVVLVAAAPGLAMADLTFLPSPSNGQRVYLSRACHDRGSGACQENFGCSGHEGENAWSAIVTKNMARDTSNTLAELLDRQYPVRIGTGLTSANINNSNAWGSLMHIPVHSNAVGGGMSNWDCTAPYSSSQGGTWGFYRTTNGSQLSNQFRVQIGIDSPGTNDRNDLRTDLGELNSTTAVAGYLEAGFHTYRPDMDWLMNEGPWVWRMGLAVDQCRGYPRSGQGNTQTKQCTW